jgi:hypothetical protein
MAKGPLGVIGLPKGEKLAWLPLGHPKTSEVGEVLERLVRRIERHLRRSGQLRTIDDEGEAGRRRSW